MAKKRVIKPAKDTYRKNTVADIWQAAATEVVGEIIRDFDVDIKSSLPKFKALILRQERIWQRIAAKDKTLSRSIIRDALREVCEISQLVSRSPAKYKEVSDLIKDYDLY